MGYYVHAVARTHSFYDDIVVKLPIIIEPMVRDDDGYIVKMFIFIYIHK